MLGFGVMAVLAYGLVSIQFYEESFNEDVPCLETLLWIYYRIDVVYLNVLVAYVLLA